MSKPETGRREINIISNNQGFTISLKFPILLSKASQLVVTNYLTNTFGNELLNFDFGREGKELFLVVRRNPHDFQKMKTYAERVKLLAEARST